MTLATPTECTSCGGVKDVTEDVYKILVVGDVGVGKSSLIRRYVYNKYIVGTKPTIGVDFALKRIRWSDRVNIALQIWDVAGQERFGSMTRAFYKGADAAVIVYDVERLSTLDGALKWKQDLDLKVPDLPVVLLANKCEGPPDDQSVGRTESKVLDDFCADNEILAFFLTSAKDPTKLENIDRAFKRLVTEIRKRAPLEYDTDCCRPDAITLSEEPPANGFAVVAGNTFPKLITCHRTPVDHRNENVFCDREITQ